MIYVTGDTHGLYDYYKLDVFDKTYTELNIDDYVIVCGDFGGVWSKDTLDYYLGYYKRLKFTVLFVDGNHENFDMLNSYPVEVWKGGKIHRIADNVIHLLRGQIFEIEGCKIFAFGGATSVDKYLRKEGESWWQAELPTMQEVDDAMLNLSKYNFEVDYVITHSCDERALYYKPVSTAWKSQKVYPDNVLLNRFEEGVKYKHWYFGHYHVDGDLKDDKTVLYCEIRELKTNKIVNIE